MRLLTCSRIFDEVFAALIHLLHNNCHIHLNDSGIFAEAEGRDNGFPRSPGEGVSCGVAPLQEPARCRISRMRWSLRHWRPMRQWRLHSPKTFRIGSGCGNALLSQDIAFYLDRAAVRKFEAILESAIGGIGRRQIDGQFAAVG